MTAPTQECSWNCEADVFEGHREKIHLGGPSRTEAEHHRPRFGHARFTQTWQDYVTVIALFSVFKMLPESYEGTSFGLKFRLKKQTTHEASENSHTRLSLLCTGIGLFSN